MHWNDQFSARARIDALVAPVVDPVSGQPASKKNVAVTVRPFQARSYGFAVSIAKPSAIDCDYWALARAEGGWRLELASLGDIGDWVEWCYVHLAIPEEIDPIGYTDTATGETRLAFFAGSRLLAALFIAPQPVAVARNWAIQQLIVTHDDLRKRFAIVAGRPGMDKPDPGATVCSCFGVGINQIAAAIHSGCHSVEAIGKQLNAGTNCGSCRAEIRGSSMGVSRPQQSEAFTRIEPLAKLPVFWALEGRRCIISGGSDAAAWKAELLAACGARVEVYADAPDDMMRALAVRPVVHAEACISLVTGPLQDADLPCGYGNCRLPRRRRSRSLPFLPPANEPVFPSMSSINHNIANSSLGRSSIVHRLSWLSRQMAGRLFWRKPSAVRSKRFCQLR